MGLNGNAFSLGVYGGLRRFRCQSRAGDEGVGSRGLAEVVIASRWGNDLDSATDHAHLPKGF